MSIPAVLVILHIIFATLWFGGPLMAAGTLKKTAAAGPKAFVAGADLANRMGTQAVVGTVGVLLTGVGLIFTVYGGMGGLPVRFHVALTLALVANIIGFGFLKPTLGSIVKAAAAPDFDPASVAGSMKKVGMFSGINHLLWLVALVLMYAV